MRVTGAWALISRTRRMSIAYSSGPRRKERNSISELLPFFDRARRGGGGRRAERRARRRRGIAEAEGGDRCRHLVRELAQRLRGGRGLFHQRGVLLRGLVELAHGGV